MATSPTKFYFGFLIVSIILWMIYTLCSRLLTWMLGATVEFRIDGWKCLCDVMVKFEKGVIESVSAGEIKLSLRQFLINLRDPKMQVWICGLEVVMRSSTSTTDLHNLESHKSRTSGRLKWIVVANIARFLSVSIADIVVKSPKVILDIKKLKMDIDKEGGTNPNLYVKLNILSILVHCCESSITSDQSFNLSSGRYSASRASSASLERFSDALICDEFSVSSDFGHDRAVGIVTRDMKIVSGDVVLYLNENLFAKCEVSSASIQDELVTSTTIASSTKKPHLREALEKYSTSFPEKVSFSLRKLDVTYKEHDLLAKNNIIGIQLNSVKSKSVGDTGEITRLGVDMKLSEIHLFRNSESSSVLKITKMYVKSILDIPIQSNLPIRAKVDIKVGGTRCDLFMSRLQPWLSLHGGTHRQTHTVDKSSQAVDMEFITWSCTVSAPEMNLMLYGLDDLPMYHLCSQPSRMSASSTGTTIQIEISELNLHLTDEPHTLSILSHASKVPTRLKYSVSLEVSQFNFSLDKNIHSIQLELQRAKSIYKEYKEAHNPCSAVTLFDMHNVKFVRRSGGLEENYECSLFSATYISLGWDPDVHLSFYELFLRLRSLVYVQRPSEDESGYNNDISRVKDVDKQKKKKSIFAIDVEMLTISTVVIDMARKHANKVEIKLEVKSIFSENASLGVLYERIILGFNGSRVFKSTRMQISRIPTSADKITWDWVLQGLDLHVCLPYKLQLRVIADSIEEMLEGLRIITIAREENIFHGNRESSEPKDPSPFFSRIRIYMRSLIADIEEEPMQGWLDEHYQLMKKEACELAVRLKFLEDFIHKATQCPKGAETSDASDERKMFFDGVEIDVEDPLAINKVKEEIHKRSFQSYYKACKGLAPSEGSGACREGFQAGFKPSTSRTSLLSVCATDIDLRLVAFRDDDDGLMEVLKKLDPICQEKHILFSRLNGSNVRLNIGSLAVQLRNYTLPLLSVTSGRCEGRIMQLRAQEADGENCISSGPQQISQDVDVGTWRKVKIFRSASGTTPPMKMYSDLGIHFKKGEVYFGVGYEPALADVSYAFSVALGALHVVEDESTLPWWDNMRNNVHGNITLSLSESKWTVLATEDPYESQDKLQIVTGPIDFQQSDGRMLVKSKDFKIELSSLESLISRHSIEVPFTTSRAAFFEALVFNLEVTMDWECESKNSLKSTSLSLCWNLSLESPIMTLGAHDLAWMLKFCGIISDPPNKLRSFYAYALPRVVRVQEVEESEHTLSLDQVLTEFMLRVDAAPFIINYMPWDSDDLVKGLTFNMEKLKYELCFSRGKQKYTLQCKRDVLDMVYLGLHLHVLKAFINKDEHPCITDNAQHPDEGFLLSSDYLTVRRQASKADSEKLLAWQEAGRRNLEKTNVQSELGEGSKSDEIIQSDPSDDDVYNVVIADNCQRVFVYGLKLLWTIENRDAVRSFVGGISKAFKPPRPSPSRQYTQRKILEKYQKESSSKMDPGKNFSSKKSSERAGKDETNETEEEGTRHFMVNVIEPQFNLHSEEANGNFLLAAVSGRVLARSFHSLMRVGVEVIEHALGIGYVQVPECIPEMTWTRMEYSIMLEHVQAYVAPTDIDPDAGLQWLPKISRNSSENNHSRALLERVFKPCEMYLRYNRHKGGTPDLKVKPLKEITFNSNNITATMTSWQYQVMMDVLNNLLFARLPPLRKSNLQYPIEDEDVEEEADEVVPYGVEEVELAKINLEEKEWERKLLLDDIRKLFTCSDNKDKTLKEKEGELWMISSRISKLVEELKKDLLYAQKSRKEASASLRVALQKAAQLQLMEKEKNKCPPPYAMSISLQINKIVWSMLLDGETFAETEINDMIYDFDRDYKDIGVTRFTTKYFVVRNCLTNEKSDMVLSAWNPPPKWGKKYMLRVDSKHGAPKDGTYPVELFHVEIYPLRIHLIETMYTMIWEYFFPGEEQVSQRREQEVWKTKNVEASRVSSTTVQSQRNNDCFQKSNTLNLKSSTSVLAQELRGTSSIDMTWEETVAESVANELVLSSQSRTVSSSIEQQEDFSKQKLKETKPGKKSKPKKMKKMKGFHNIKISQVELLITYVSSRNVVTDIKLLMDTYHRAEFTGTWGGVFTRVKKHIIWGVLKSITGMQMTKFKDFQMKKLKGKSLNNLESILSELDDLSDDDQMEKPDQQQVTWFKHQSDGAGKRFVTSIRGLFYAQRRLRGESENDSHGEWSDSDVESSLFAKQSNITKARRLIRRHTEKFRLRSQSGSSSQQESLLSSPKETTAVDSDDTSGSSF